MEKRERKRVRRGRREGEKKRDTRREGRVGDERVNSRKRRGEFNSRELARDEIAARRLVASDLGHNYLNARGWINCCISHAKLILIHGPLSSALLSSLLALPPSLSPDYEHPRCEFVARQPAVYLQSL